MARPDRCGRKDFMSIVAGSQIRFRGPRWVRLGQLVGYQLLL